MSKILMVDDDKIIRAVTSRILIESGYEVEQAGSLEEARELVSLTDFTLIITDMNMPDSQGSNMIETLKKIRPQSEVVVMTGFGTLDAAVECMRAGAVDFLLKPCSSKQLLETVRKVVAKKELSRENTMLRVLNEMKDKFLSLVSHELRTPLTLIYGYLTILQRQSMTLSEDQISLLNIILKSTRQLINIVNNIQIITQAESGEMKLHLQPIPPRKMLADVLAEMKASTTQRKLSMQLEEGEELEPIMGDSIRLRQAIMELIQNAIRNTPDDGEIRVGARRQVECLVVWVRDNGIGIPVEEQGKIFETFYEVADVKQHTSSNSRFGGGGMGIGLSLVKGVVEAHRGKIRLESEPGKGSYFEITIPADLQQQLPPSSLAAKFDSLE
jgi:signal transduction histidine kinase